MFHCTKFRPNDIWYLDNNELFESRELRLGICPQCGKEVGELCEKRKIDGKIFYESVSGKKLDWLKKKEKNLIIYTSQECNLKRFKNTNCGWVYGVHTETNKKQKKYIRQFSCDFYGNKELQKEIIING